jgi:hypothetical protein
MTKKAPAAKKPAARKKPAPKETPAEAPTKEPTLAVKFQEVKDWPDCKGQQIRLWHPALGMGPEANGYHKAKVLSVNLATGTILVAIATDKMKGRYLLPIDSAAARVK